MRHGGLIAQTDIDVGTVDGGVAARGPTGASLQVGGVNDVADEDLAAVAGGGRLGVAAQAKIGIALGEHFAVQGAVRIVAGGAAFAHGGVLENDGACLLTMALGATFVLTGHGQAAGGLENIAAVRIMALDAIHAAFENRVMAQGLKFGAGLKMALQATDRVFAGVDDEFGAAAGFDVFAAGTVARFAAGVAVLAQSGEMDAGVGTGGEVLDDGGVAIQAGFVADFVRARNDRGDIHGAISRGTRIHEEAKRCCGQREGQDRQAARVFQIGQAHERAIRATDCLTLRSSRYGMLFSRRRAWQEGNPVHGAGIWADGVWGACFVLRIGLAHSLIKTEQSGAREKSHVRNRTALDGGRGFYGQIRGRRKDGPVGRAGCGDRGHGQSAPAGRAARLAAGAFFANEAN